MTSVDEVAPNEHLARERREADQRYNQALTDLDRVVVSLGTETAIDRADLSRLATAPIVFLQQITAFVETKDREIVATAGARIGGIERALERTAELRTQLTVVQRAVQMLTRAVGRQEPATSNHQPATSSQQPATSNQQPVTRVEPRVASSDYKYVGFEDAFRGSGEAIAQKLRAYVPIFAGAIGDVVDLECGRGELVAALMAAGLSARGVDMNGDMAAIARERGLDAAVNANAAILNSLLFTHLDYAAIGYRS